VTPRSTRSKSVGERVVSAISHPIRLEIQRILYYREASPKEVAMELGEGVSNVSHHFRVLEEEGCIEEVGTEQRRGAVKHIYRAIFPTHHDDASWARLPRATRDDITGLTLQGLMGEALRALNQGTFNEREDRHLSWMPIELDEQGCREILESQAQWLEEIGRIKEEAADRLGEESGQRFVAAMMGFATPPGFGLKKPGADR
jgi:DNA-binding transcriptional ArsR family regulator